jgi:AGZA family xanthine/uracil permease-like MFS transporter
MVFIEKTFQLSLNKTSLKQEIIGGSTTFMTMAYIIFVQPVVLSAAGMDFGAVITATCISSALAIFLMGLYANYPVALAPGMGQNFFFAYTVVLTMGVSWQLALGMVFVAGVLFVILTLVGLRSKMIDAIPESLKHAIAIGIGLMITLIGLEWAGLVVDHPTLLVTLGDFGNPATQLALVGLLIISILLIRRVPGAMLIGILSTTLIGWAAGLISFSGLFSTPPSIQPTLLKLDIAGTLQLELLPVMLTFLILAMFDTIGTLVGVANQAGFLVDGKLPRAEKALFSDAVGTLIGALGGTSTITAYIESASGVASGARTGLANIFTGILFLLALFFYPLIQMIAGEVKTESGLILHPCIAPVLILVGIYMMKSVRYIPWEDFSESIPAFLTFVFIPFSFRITEGIAIGFISYVILKIVKGEVKKIPLLLWIFAGIFLIRYLF